MFNFRLHRGTLEYQCRCIMILRFTIAFLENENQYRTAATLHRKVNGKEGVQKIHPSFRLTPLCYYVHSTYSPYRIAVSDVIYKQFVRPYEMLFDVVFYSRDHTKIGMFIHNL